MIVLKPWEDVRSETWAMFDFFEKEGKILRLDEDCIQEHMFVLDCGNCGGYSRCAFCGKKGKYVEPFPIGWEIGFK